MTRNIENYVYVVKADHGYYSKYPVHTSGLQVTKNPATGDVLTSDSFGNATWQPGSSKGFSIAMAVALG